MREMEILAPVGSWPMFYAALKAGADAIYLAGKNFGARAYAKNFSLKELEELISIAHLHHIKVYVTVNTVIKEKEMEEALQYVFDLYNMGTDALIVADLGLIKLVRSLLPDFELHGSTQLSVSSLKGVKAVEALGLSRIVLARELTIDEIKEIQKETSIELEVFIHGSLCVCVSGRCLMSSFQGGRSGNRGRCAQPCRKQYQLLKENGEVVGEKDSYLSPRDLNVLEDLNQLKDIGIHSLKIEGRMKKPDYVYQVVRAYKEALASQEVDSNPLKIVSQRPFTKGFLFEDFGRSFHFSDRDEKGLAIGKINRQGKDIFFQTSVDLLVGDSVSVEGKKHRFSLTLKKNYRKGQRVDLSSYPDLISSSNVLLHDRKQFMDEIESLEIEKKPLSLYGEFFVGKEAYLKASSLGHTFELRGQLVEKAEKKIFTRSHMEEALGKLGSSPFYLKDLTLHMDDTIFLARSVINGYRRLVINGLLKEIGNKARKKKKPIFSFEKNKTNACKNISITLETKEKPYAYVSLKHIKRVYLEDPHLIKAWKKEGVEVFYLPLNFRKTMDDKEFEGFDGYYLRTLNDLSNVSLPLVLGKEINLMNSQALDLFPSAISMQASLECNKEEIIQLANASSLPMEIDVYGDFPSMVTRYCPFSVLKNCKDEKGCTTCVFRKGFLRDSYDQKMILRKDGYSEIFLSDTIDYRKIYREILEIKPQWIKIKDDGQKESKEVLAFWQEALDGKDLYVDHEGYYGHFKKGIE